MTASRTSLVCDEHCDLGAGVSWAAGMADFKTHLPGRRRGDQAADGQQKLARAASEGEGAAGLTGVMGCGETRCVVVLV